MRYLFLPSALASAAVVAGCTGEAATTTNTPTIAVQTAAIDLPSYFPAASEVRLRVPNGTGASPGTAVLTATLDANGLQRLQAVTGQQTLASISGPSGTVVLRDDGRKGDPVAGDGRFTGAVHVSAAAVRARAELEEDIADAGGLEDLPRFDGHELVAYESREPMSLSDLMAGKDVTVAPLPASLTPADWEKLVGQSLFITDDAVIFDIDRTMWCGLGTPDGVWTFEHLMRQMAGEQDPETFVEHWITQLANGVPAGPGTNGFALAGNDRAQLILNAWPRINGELDLAQSPFHLLAITPRIDLRPMASSAYGGTADLGGELRFVFGAMMPDTCQALDFTVIFEFGVPLRDCHAQKDWAQAWLDLQSYFIGNVPNNNYQDFAGALESLTLAVTEAGAGPGNINGSALHQLRTNTRVGLFDEWRIREFHLAETGMLEAATVAATPADHFRTAANASFLDAFFLMDLTDPVPLSITDAMNQTAPFLGAEAVIDPQESDAWGFAANPSANRHQRALDTCSGCHGIETVDAGTFTIDLLTHMINPVDGQTSPGDAAVISPFLIGGANPSDFNVDHHHNDPMTGAQHTFFDLKRRYLDMLGVSNQLCAEFPVDDLNNSHISE